MHDRFYHGNLVTPAFHIWLRNPLVLPIVSLPVISVKEIYLKHLRALIVSRFSYSFELYTMYLFMGQYINWLIKHHEGNICSYRINWYKSIHFSQLEFWTIRFIASPLQTYSDNLSSASSNEGSSVLNKSNYWKKLYACNSCSISCSEREWLFLKERASYLSNYFHPYGRSSNLYQTICSYDFVVFVDIGAILLFTKPPRHVFQHFILWTQRDVLATTLWGFLTDVSLNRTIYLQSSRKIPSNSFGTLLPRDICRGRNLQTETSELSPRETNLFWIFFN